MKQEPMQNNPNQWGKSGADIVERLREHNNSYTYGYPILIEAADEIELRRREIGTYVLECADLRAEIERLKERAEKAEAYMDKFAAEANRLRERVMEAENRQGLAEKMADEECDMAFQAGIATGRQLALEEAARVAEAQAVKWESIGETNHAGVIADAIRALVGSVHSCRA